MEIINFLTFGATTWQEYAAVFSLWAVVLFGLWFCVNTAREETITAGVLASMVVIPVSFFLGLMVSLVVGVLLGASP